MNENFKIFKICKITREKKEVKTAHKNMSFQIALGLADFIKRTRPDRLSFTLSIEECK